MNHLKDQPVALVRCETYEASALDASLAEAFRLSGGVDVEGKRVLLKPNILRDAPPEKGITTNPDFLRAVIRLIKAEGAASVAVGDSPGFQKPGFSGELCGFEKRRYRKEPNGSTSPPTRSSSRLRTGNR
jgi:uncharacterized protein (DUF362 family)